MKNEIEILMNDFTHFTSVDLIGFAKIVGVDPVIVQGAVKKITSGDGDLEELICEIPVVFQDLPRKNRRSLLKIANSVAKENIAAEKNGTKNDDFEREIVRKASESFKNQIEKAKNEAEE